MRYYCPECESELITDYVFVCSCPYCKGNKLDRIPQWETPSDYEKRTGREWHGAVWVRWDIRNLEQENAYSDWNLTVAYDDIHYDQYLCADKDCSPPDDWKE